METIWLPALLIVFALALIIFGPSRIASIVALVGRKGRALLSRLRERRDPASRPAGSKRPPRPR